MGEPTTFAEMFKLLSEQNIQQTQKLSEQIRSSEKNVTSQLKKSNQKIEEINNRNVILERKIRKNNILFHGFKAQNKNNLVNETISKLNELFSLNIRTSDLNNLYRLGKTETAPILIEFISYLTKSEIFRDAQKLRDLQQTDYAISNDLCEEDRKDLKILRQHLKKAKEENKQARIKGLKLEVDNKVYEAKDLDGLDSDTEKSDTESSATSSSEEEVDPNSLASPEIVSGNIEEAGKNKKKRKKSKTPSPPGKNTRSKIKRR